MQFHDYFRILATQNVAYAVSGGASAASAAFGSQTRWIRVAAVVGTAAAIGDGVRIVVGDGTPTATATSAFLPPNWVEYIKCSPGQRVAVLGNNAGGTGTVSVSELTD
jgi:hypothetical protein